MVQIAIPLEIKNSSRKIRHSVCDKSKDVRVKIVSLPWYQHIINSWL